jgi:hypothetical protein
MYYIPGTMAVWWWWKDAPRLTCIELQRFEGGDSLVIEIMHNQCEQCRWHDGRSWRIGV